MKTKTSFTKENAPNRGLFGDKHPTWKGGTFSGRETYKEWTLDRKEDYRKYVREYLRRERVAVLELLGGDCVRCGFNDSRALQIDHINAGGSKERKERTYKGTFHANVIKSHLAGENKYQLLCANCNWIKRTENDERNTK